METQRSAKSSRQQATARTVLSASNSARSLREDVEKSERGSARRSSRPGATAAGGGGDGAPTARSTARYTG
eukprot:CAMPEP_0206373786 /NCGR_PEP_ID=MMETSP0294-20121207/7921_1 /ASSEMBLY_ACC=CAM_ASM_000327 /TAXON_ID=39354 /ORGANISM="Heterosigma akashiwo, Strain CCMP2393" /LENGTH=70 /DNA_ID=CAMNT_0053821441 /DNA_START=202 /DNA_END=411 /DNA_ORIENTATION=-